MPVDAPPVLLVALQMLDASLSNTHGRPDDDVVENVSADEGRVEDEAWWWGAPPPPPNEGGIEPAREDDAVGTPPLLLQPKLGRSDGVDDERDARGEPNGEATGLEWRCGNEAVRVAEEVLAAGGREPAREGEMPGEVDANGRDDEGATGDEATRPA